MKKILFALIAVRAHPARHLARKAVRPSGHARGLPRFLIAERK